MPVKLFASLRQQFYVLPYHPQLPFFLLQLLLLLSLVVQALVLWTQLSMVLPLLVLVSSMTPLVLSLLLLSYYFSWMLFSSQNLIDTNSNEGRRWDIYYIHWIVRVFNTRHSFNEKTYQILVLPHAMQSSSIPMYRLRSETALCMRCHYESHVIWFHSFVVADCVVRMHLQSELLLKPIGGKEAAVVIQSTQQLPI